MNFGTARELAASWVSLATDGTAAIYREKTIALPYGWVFFYNSKEFLADPRKLEASLVGNVPILVDRINGELRVLGLRYTDRLKELERELPPASLQMKPELPRW
ncbi:YrhB domain-containing protein [Pseudorhodoferax sp. Leaf274]|uniref:YrhB domain-containing protein n=1 Tax=Pseudorhodoferax sp. Leaf274 TaxID=1736318 RepID=UPI0009E90A82|nr:YrhB domain-containing protein [Pseudorhodoferax sp. Leaf274]